MRQARVGLLALVIVLIAMPAEAVPFRGIMTYDFTYSIIGWPTQDPIDAGRATGTTPYTWDAALVPCIHDGFCGGNPFGDLIWRLDGHVLRLTNAGALQGIFVVNDSISATSMFGGEVLGGLLHGYSVNPGFTYYEGPGGLDGDVHPNPAGQFSSTTGLTLRPPGGADGEISMSLQGWFTLHPIPIPAPAAGALVVIGLAILAKRRC